MLRAEKLAVAGRLAASVAHEINNPLEAVANLLYLITTADTIEEARDRGNQAMDELMRVSMIARQFAEVSSPGWCAEIDLAFRTCGVGAGHVPT